MRDCDANEMAKSSGDQEHYFVKANSHQFSEYQVRHRANGCTPGIQKCMGLVAHSSTILQKQKHSASTVRAQQTQLHPMQHPATTPQATTIPQATTARHSRGKSKEPTSPEIALAIDALHTKFPTVAIELVVSRLYQKMDSLLPKEQLRLQSQLSEESFPSETSNPGSVTTQQHLYPYPQNLETSKVNEHQAALAMTIAAAIARLKQQEKDPRCIAHQHRLRRLVSITQPRLQMIVDSPEAQELRATLCSYLDSKGFDIKMLTSTILEVNELISRVENEAIRQDLLRKKEENSIERAEYCYVGKRKKVLVLKQPRKAVLGGESD